MSKAISILLDQPESIIKRAVNILEDKNGYPSHDVRHLANTIQAIRTKIADLGLDADDTTAEELYHALLIKFQTDSQIFDNHYSPILQTDDQKAANAANLVSHSGSLPEVWSLKSSTAKSLLKTLPPKKLMKHLGYRSVDSLLKRQNLAEIHLMLGQFESSTWSRVYAKKINSLDSSNFELGPLKIASPSTIKWGELSTEAVVDFEANFGVLGIMPTDERKDLPLLSIVILLADALSSFDDNAAGSRLAQISPLVAWWQDMDGLVANLSGQCVSLNIIDMAANHAAANQLADQQLDNGRQSFWQGLVSRYDNLLTAEEDLKMSFKYQPLVIKAPINQPAFEYVEDI